MDVEVSDNRGQSRFEGQADSELVGFAAYQRGGGRIAFTHTEVEDRFEGEGVGSQLAAAALDSAREEGLAVLPFCPFIREYIADHEEYLDLVPDDARARFDL